MLKQLQPNYSTKTTRQTFGDSKDTKIQAQNIENQNTCKIRKLQSINYAIEFQIIESDLK